MSPTIFGSFTVTLIGIGCFSVISPHFFHYFFHSHHYRRLTALEQSTTNELARLAQGFDGIKGTDTLEFIHKNKVPKHKKVTYGNMICDFQPLKNEQYRVRLTVEGDRLPYDDDPGSPRASLLETKLLLNSVISDSKSGTRFCTADLKDHFLATPMEGEEHMRIHSKYFLTSFANNLSVVCGKACHNNLQ